MFQLDKNTLQSNKIFLTIARLYHFKVYPLFIMSNRDRINKKSSRPSNSGPSIEQLLGRRFADGSLPRYGRLEETDFLQTRPFTPPNN